MNSFSEKDHPRASDGKFTNKPGMGVAPEAGFVHDDEPVLTVKPNGDKKWRLPNGKLHRVDGPAVERADGTKEWCVNGKFHREDDPAVEYANGTKEWWIDGKRRQD